MMKLINGYIVVRKPQYCARVIEGVGDIQSQMQVNEVSYLGVDRLPWETIEDEYYSDSLNQKGEELYSKINQRIAHGLKVVKDYNLANKILEYSNRNSVHSEIIAIYSSKLNDVVSCKEIEHDFELIGIDPWCDGYGSMLKLGYFLKPELFKVFMTTINQFGLFDTEEAARKYSLFYKEQSLQQKVEPVAGKVEYIRIWKHN